MVIWGGGGVTRSSCFVQEAAVGRGSWAVVEGVL